MVRLAADTDLLAFPTGHGINPVALSPASTFGAAMWDYEEEVLSAEPFEARFTLTVDGDALTLHVDDGLDVVDASR